MISDRWWDFGKHKWECTDALGNLLQYGMGELFQPASIGSQCILKCQDNYQDNLCKSSVSI